MRGDGSVIERLAGGAYGFGRIAVVLLATIGCMAAADGGGQTSVTPTLGERLTQLIIAVQAYPRWTGPVTAALGLIPLFYGWQLTRWSTAICSAATTGGAVLAITMPPMDPALAWTMAVSAAIIAGLLGFFLYQAVMAVLGGLLGFAIGATLVASFAPQANLAALAVGLITAAVGFVFAWRVAPYTGIVGSVIYAYLMILEGMIVLCRPDPGGEAWALAAVVGVVTVVPGLFVQVRAQSRHDS